MTHHIPTSAPAASHGPSLSHSHSHPHSHSRSPFPFLFLLPLLLLPFTASAQLPFTSQFVFNAQSWNLSIGDGSGASYEVLITDMPGTSRDSFPWVGDNLPVFTQEFSTRLCSLASAQGPNDQEMARNIAQQQFLSFFAATSVAGSDAPLAVTVFVRDLVPTINLKNYNSYKSTLDESYKTRRKSLTAYLNSHATDLRMLRKVSKQLGDTLTIADRHTIVNDSLGKRASMYKKRHSRVESYMRTIANRRTGLMGYFAVDSVEMEIMDGSIRNIAVRGRQFLVPANAVGQAISEVEIVNDTTVRINGSKRMSVHLSGNQYLNNFAGDSLIVQHPVVYVSQCPIPVSSISNFGDLNGVMLVNLAEPRSEWVLPMALLLKMVPELALNSDDYSPQNGLYTLYPRSAGSTQPSARLYKEQTKDLFVARVYSDFVGIQDDSPNGLIQTDVSKRIILNPQNLDGTFFNFLEPRLAFTKIENKQKFLPSVTSIDTIGDTAYTSMLQVFRYSKFNFGTRLNLFRLDVPKAKLSLFVNSGAYLYQTAFSDTTISLDTAGVATRLADTFNGNTFSWESEVEVNFLPDPRYGLSLSCTYRYMNLLNDHFDPEGRSLMGAMLSGYFTPNSALKNTLFFRGGIQFLPGDVDQNFVQLQLGYAVNIIR